MRSLLPILSVLLALVAAGSIAYIAWELTSEKPDERDDEPSVDEPSEDENG